MTQPDGYHDDTFESEQKWLQRPGGWLATASSALVAVGAAAVVGWLWLALRSQGILGDGGAGLFDVTPAQRIDFLVSTLDALVLALLAITLGLALRRYAESAGN